MIGVLLIAALAGVCLFLNWRTCLKLALTIVVFEGALRKWVFPGQETAILFLKDVALLVCYVKYFGERGFSMLKAVPVPILCLLGAAFIVAVIDTLNPHLSSGGVGLFGLKAYFYYAPLLWISIDYLDRSEHLEDLAAWQMQIAIPVFALAYLQFFAPADSPLNVYASSMGERMDAATVGESGNVRVTGTFPYISGMGCFVNFIALLALYLFLFSKSNRRQTLGLVGLTMSIIAGLMTGSRSVVFFLVALVGFSLFVAQNARRARAIVVLRSLLAFAVLTIVIKMTSAFAAIDAFMERVRTTDDTYISLMGPLPATWEMIEYSGVAGYGTGATHQARPAIEQLLHTGSGDYPPDLYEWEYPRIMLELGPVGFVPWFGVRLLVIFLPFFVAHRVADPGARSFSLLLGVAMLLQYTIPNVFNHVYSLYFWLLAGLSLAILRWPASAVPSVRSPKARRMLVPRPLHRPSAI